MDFTKDKLEGYVTKLKELSKANKGSEAELATVLASLETDGFDTVASLGVAVGEATTRKASIRTLKQENEELTLDKQELEKKVSAEDPNKEELDRLRTFHTNTINGQRDAFGGFIEKVSEHENFEKASPDFKLPKPDDDGKYDLKDMSQEDLEHNVTEMNRFNRLGIFGEVGNGQGLKKIVEGSGPEKIIPKSLQDRIDAAKTPQELQEIQDSLD